MLLPCSHKNDIMQQWFAERGQGVLQGQAGIRAPTHVLITVVLLISLLAFEVPGRILFKNKSSGAYNI